MRRSTAGADNYLDTRGAPLFQETLRRGGGATTRSHDKRAGRRSFCRLAAAACHVGHPKIGKRMKRMMRGDAIHPREVRGCGRVRGCTGTAWPYPLHIMSAHMALVAIAFFTLPHGLEST